MPNIAVTTNHENFCESVTLFKRLWNVALLSICSPISRRGCPTRARDGVFGGGDSRKTTVGALMM